MGISFRLPDSSDEQPLDAVGLAKLQGEIEARNEKNPLFRYRLVLENRDGKKVLTCRKLTWGEIVGGGKSATTTAKLTEIVAVLNKELIQNLHPIIDKFIDKKIVRLTENTNQKLQEIAYLVSKLKPAKLEKRNLEMLMNTAFKSGKIDEGFTFFFQLSEDAQLEVLETSVALTDQLTEERVNAHREFFEMLYEKANKEVKFILIPLLEPEAALQVKVELLLDFLKNGKLNDAQEQLNDLSKIAFTDSEIIAELRPKILEMLTQALRNEDSRYFVNLVVELIQKMDANLLEARDWFQLLQSANKRDNSDLMREILRKTAS